MLHFVGWLRDKANMRSVSILVAAEFVKARLDAEAAGYVPADRHGGLPACRRAGRVHRLLAHPARSQPADAGQARCGRRCSQARTPSGRRCATTAAAGAMRLGDVVELVHPTPDGPEQSALFGWLLDRRHGRRETPAADLALLTQVTARARLNELPIGERHAFARRVLAVEPVAEIDWMHALAGQWEWGKSWLGQDAEDKTFERVSPTPSSGSCSSSSAWATWPCCATCGTWTRPRSPTDLVKHVKACWPARTR